jgi:hypothetical protein
MGNAAAPEQVERRRNPRWPCALKAHVRLNKRSPVLDCTVQDMSHRGARIAFPTVLALPRSFVLEIPSLDLHVEAKRVWSQAECHGVMFVWPQRTMYV